MRFFFYGSLLPALAPTAIASTIRRGHPLGNGEIRGQLYDLGDYPAGVVDPEAPTKITGQVFEFPDDEAVIRELDAYEDFDPERPATSLFVRRLVNVDVPDGRTLPCWTYLYERDLSGKTPIPEGDYAHWRAKSRGVSV